MTGVAGASVLGVTVPTGSVDYSFRLYGYETTRHPTKSLAPCSPAFKPNERSRTSALQDHRRPRAAKSDEGWTKIKMGELLHTYKALSPGPAHRYAVAVAVLASHQPNCIIILSSSALSR